MAVKQYVGARYVPVFADPVEWQAGRSYEALTIVTYLNNSYTSKQPVPENIGNPYDNPLYWVVTGNYNSQVEQYRQEVVKIGETVTGVKGYGAKGDGINDDTSSILLAIADDNFYVPAGIYVATDDIKQYLKSLYGEGIIRYTVNNDSVDLPLNVVDNIVITVPTFFNDANDVITSYLSYRKVIHATIKYIDGTYYENQLSINGMSLGGLNVIGNTSDPTKCLIELTESDTAFYLSSSNIGYINGFSINGKRRNNNSFDLIQTAIFANDDSFIKIGKAIIIDSCYYGIQAAANSMIEIEAGDNFTDVPVYSDTFIDSYSGKNPIVINAGDCCYFAYDHSLIRANRAIAMYAKDSDNNLGFGFMAEHGSTIDLSSCIASNNFIAGVCSANGASIIDRMSHAWNNNFGYYTRDNSVIECNGSDAYQNINGYKAYNARIKCNNTLSNNSSGDSYYASNSGQIIVEDATANYSGGLGFNVNDISSTIEPVEKCKGNNNTLGLYRAKFRQGSIIAEGRGYIGDVLIPYIPTSNIIMQICTVEGIPGTWTNIGGNV